MKKWLPKRSMKYEAELDPKFALEIASLPGGEKLFGCIQCGTCAGTCPVSQHMDYTPRRIIAMIRAGFKREVLSSVTTWLCASCYSCTVECPKNIKITDIMYALKRRAIQEGLYPRRRFPIPILARDFYEIVQRNGRNSEGRLTLKLFSKSDLIGLVKQTALGLKLWSQGRISFKTESIKRKSELRRVLNSLEEARRGSVSSETFTGTGEVS